MKEKGSFTYSRIQLINVERRQIMENQHQVKSKVKKKAKTADPQLSNLREVCENTGFVKSLYGPSRYLLTTKCVSHSIVSDSAIPWTVAHQASCSMGFSRSEYWSELAFPSSGDLPNPRTKPRFPSLQADSLLSQPPRKSY